MYDNDGSPIPRTRLLRCTTGVEVAEVSLCSSPLQEAHTDDDSLALNCFSGSQTFGSHDDLYDLSGAPNSEASSICDSRVPPEEEWDMGGESDQLLDPTLESCAAHAEDAETASATSAKEAGRKWSLRVQPSGAAAVCGQPGSRRALEHVAEAPKLASREPRKRDRPQLRVQGAVQHVDLALLQEGGYLDMPIAEAARRLGISLTALKVAAHQQGIQRWPFRSRQSLRNVIESTKHLVEDNVLSVEDGLQMRQLLDALETELEEVGMTLKPCVSATIKRYRQSIFKITHQLKTTTSLQARLPAAVRTALAQRDPQRAERA
ncbi:hypothetical protein WJX72_004403 [[Myrmecia] bisecta]|uniref:RWP-RK domain-containing protein n=1 Tax=[Myrmecia] bisecta TaxID=41462 RepID=A0AAW1PCJ7_9CHLO